MTELRQVYKCNICGNIVEILHTGRGTLVCCNQPMELLVEKTGGVGEEKHIPLIEKEDDIIKVKVGSITHPMEKDHYIEWIEVITDNGVHRKFFNPGDIPEAEFTVRTEKVKVRAYCNIHGLWRV